MRTRLQDEKLATLLKERKAFYAPTLSLFQAQSNRMADKIPIHWRRRWQSENSWPTQGSALFWVQIRSHVAPWLRASTTLKEMELDGSGRD